MPEMIQKTDHLGHPTGDVDWSKIFMGFAMALVFVMQQWHSIQMSDIKADMVQEPKLKDIMRTLEMRWVNIQKGL